MINFTNYYGYVRVSTESQNVVSLEAQETAIRKHFPKIKKIVREVGSAYGKNDVKRKFHEFIKTIKDATLVVYDISRLSRNLNVGVDLIQELKTRNITIAVIEPEVKVLNNTELFNGVQRSQDESRMLGIKVKSSLKQRREEGYFTGSIAPFGWEKTRDERGYVLTPNPNEIPIQNFIYICKNHKVYSSLLNNLMTDMLNAQYKASVYCDQRGWVLVRDYIQRDGKYHIQTEYGDAVVDKITDIETMIEQCPIVCGIADEKRWRDRNTVILDNIEVVNLLNEYGIRKRGRKFSTSSLVHSISKMVEIPSFTPLPVEDMMDSMSINDDKDVYEVEKILGKRPRDNTYLVKWVGWNDKYNEWVKESDILDKNLIRDYKNSSIEEYKYDSDHTSESSYIDCVSPANLVSEFIKYCQKMKIEKTNKQAIDILDSVDWNLEQAIDTLF